MMDYRCKLDKDSFAKHFILFSLLIFFSCNKAEIKSREPSSVSIKEQTKNIDPASDSICFDGNSDDGQACFFAISKEDVIRESSDYTYLNPLSDQSFPSLWDPTFYEMPSEFIDLDREDSNISITQNFKLIEVMQAQKTRFGYFSPFVTNLLQDMRSQTNRSIRVNSAYRSPAYNAGISGSAKWSRHQYGDAVDLYISGLSVQEMGDLCAKFNADFVLRYKTHIHCDWRWTAKLEDYPNLKPFESSYVSALTAKTKHIQNLSETTQIVINKSTFYNGDSITLSIHSELGEDHEELLNDWEVLTPSGEKLTRTSSELVLTNIQSGIYKIKALAGGLINVSHTFSVE